MRKIISLACSFLLCANIATKSQPVSPTAPDFANIYADWVTATYGDFDHPYVNTGIHPDRHAVLILPGTDKYTDGRLSIKPEEDTPFVVRLGADRHGQSESISYRFVVDPEKTLLKVQMAIVANEDYAYGVLADSYNRTKNSDFIIQTKSISDQAQYACANFNFKNSTYYLPLSQSLVPHRAPWWIEWSDVILDLTPFSGQEVEVSFTKKAGQEYGWMYVYYTANCISAKIEMHDCTDNKFKLTPPEGYKDYQWFDELEEPTLSWQTGDNDMRLSCATTSRNTTKPTYIAFIHLHGDVPESDRIIFDTIQQGDTYNKNLFDLGALLKTGDYVYHQTFCDASTCSSRTMYSLFLRVNQRYYPIEAQICEGEDYVDNGFEWHSPTAGLYYDTLRLTSSLGRDSIVCLKLSVSMSHVSPDRITGNTSPCTGVQEHYAIPFSGYKEGDSFRWEVPDGAVLTSSSFREMDVVFTDPNQAGNIVLHYATGCTSGTVSFAVTPQPSFQQFYADSVCSGNEYHKNNFHLPRQDEEGMKLHYQFHKTVAGCDSILSLALTVLPSPQIRILRSDSVICEGDEVQLYAQNLATIPAEEPDDFISVGDIYCSDGSIIRPAEYAASGKTAEGVVFWVDKSGKHGWIVNKEESCDDCTFVIAENIPLPEGIGTDLEDMLPTDTAGYSNTQKFWESGRIGDYPAMKSVAFDKGWYLPAAKQFLALIGSLFAVEPILETIGGTIVLPLDENNYYNQERRFYYTSTRDEDDYIWSCERSQNHPLSRGYSIILYPNTKTLHAHTRSVRNF